MNKNLSKVIAVVGPTASGKTDYAINLAKEINGEIVSADSRLVYKNFNIATAKPDYKEMSGIKHYMIDLVEPTINYSVGLYVNEAKQVIKKIIANKKVPIIVGGTGLYINALLMNYDLPRVAPNYELRKELEKLDNVYDVLSGLDIDAANKIDFNDRKKIIRTIEVIKTTGKKISETRSKKDVELEVEWIGRNFERAELYERINNRVDLMLEKGLVDETKFLLNKYGRIDNIVNTIGYQEMVGFLDGKYTINTAIEKLKQNTRNYAKRQLTWFRKNELINWNVYPKILKR